MTSKTPRYVTDTILNFIGGSCRQGSDEKTFVNVNPATAQKIGTVFGGSGHSGISRESGVHSLEFYTETENICVKP